tara:strand:+ start:195 stop:566 length:372 start_codon:yes stop_codon:yes gene_type:complete
LVVRKLALREPFTTSRFSVDRVVTAQFKKYAAPNERIGTFENELAATFSASHFADAPRAQRPSGVEAGAACGVALRLHFAPQCIDLRATPSPDALRVFVLARMKCFQPRSAPKLWRSVSVISL